MIIGKLLALTIQPMIMEAIKGGQLIDPRIEKFKQEVVQKKQSNFFISEDGVLGYKGGRICALNNEKIKRQILHEAHNTPYALHLSITKMYRLEETFLVAKNEEERGGLCGKMLDLSTSES